MNIQSFLEHHGIIRNPFAEEDAQTDQVFKEHCISSAYHPIWDKVYGDPKEPSTSIIFGPKGSGKTAIRLQIDQHLNRYNDEHPSDRVFVIRYDDFNPFLDHFCERMSRRTTRKPEKVLDAWRLWDHMDAILCLGVTDLVDRILGTRPRKPSEAISSQSIDALDRTSARDMLLLAACYDQSTASTFTDRWNDLRKRLHFGNLQVIWSLVLAIASGLFSVILVAWMMLRDSGADGRRRHQPAGALADPDHHAARLDAVPDQDLQVPAVPRWEFIATCESGNEKPRRCAKCCNSFRPKNWPVSRCHASIEPTTATNC